LIQSLLGSRENDFQKPRLPHDEPRRPATTSGTREASVLGFQKLTIIADPRIPQVPPPALSLKSGPRANRLKRSPSLALPLDLAGEGVFFSAR
jgi:hypothetical protein